MPNRETPTELADHIANMLGIYCDHPEETFQAHEGGEHCRIDFCIEMADRIRKAAQVERQEEPRPENALHLRVEVWEAGDEPEVPGAGPARARVVLRGIGDDKKAAAAFAKHLYEPVDIWMGKG